MLISFPHSNSVHFKMSVEQFETDMRSPTRSRDAVRSRVPMHSPEHTGASLEDLRTEHDPSDNLTSSIGPGSASSMPRTAHSKSPSPSPSQTPSRPDTAVSRAPGRVFSEKTDVDGLREGQKEIMKRFMSQSSGTAERA